MADDFPAELRAFIAQHIESLAQLEALLRLRQDRKRPWDSDALAREIYISADMAAGILTDLERRGFVTSRYGDPTPVRGGRAKRFFRATRSGIAAVKGGLHLIQSMTAGLDEVLE